ncbi:MAG: hypothetical protein AAFO01_12320 [Pseudomonadota bacterium]
MFLPLTLVGGGRTFVLHDRAALIEHLKALEQKGQELSIAKLRTQILSSRDEVDGVTVIDSFRERLSADGTILGTVSMTWTVIRAGCGWKVSQIHFNDSRSDPSVVAQVFLKHSER